MGITFNEGLQTLAAELFPLLGVRETDILTNEVFAVGSATDITQLTSAFSADDFFLLTRDHTSRFQVMPQECWTHVRDPWILPLAELEIIDGTGFRGRKGRDRGEEE